MSEQDTLFDQAAPPREPSIAERHYGRPTDSSLVEPASRLERAFRQFHAENPRVYTILVRLAREAKARGKSDVGVGLLWEVMRWEMFLQTTDPEFKLNNNHRAYYAREIMACESDLTDFFETRMLRNV